MDNKYYFIVDEQTRLDNFLSKKLSNKFSRSYIQKLIKEGYVKINGNVVTKKNYTVKKDEEIFLIVPKPKKMDLKPVKMDLEIVYEDEYLIILNKSPGLIVHPSDSSNEITLVHGLLAHCTNLSGIGGIERPGIVHRLDKETSGLMIVAKEDKTHRLLSEMLRKHLIERIYHAITWGHLKPQKDKIITYFGRHPVKRHKMAVLNKSERIAITNYEVLQYYTCFSLVKLKLETGRTHQIRVHLSYKGTPIVGDHIYGYRIIPPHYERKIPKNLKEYIKKIPYFLLVSKTIRFTHPILKKELFFEIDYPSHFKNFLRLL